MLSQERLKKILRMPAGQIARKVWAKAQAALAHYRQRRRDLHQPTYIPHKQVGIHLENDFAVTLPIGLLRENEEEIRLLADTHWAHQFDLLGSGWVAVEHGMTCRGVEGHHYSGGPKLNADRAGGWLAGRINRANLADAQRIWSLIEHPYRPIDWHLDFKSGFRWREDTHQRDIRYGQHPGVDVKVPWELARMQHVPVLALAFALTSDHTALGQPAERLKNPYLREFRNQVLDFIATNPPRYGVNWKCTMDVAIRVANWLLAYDIFQGAGAIFDVAFRTEFTRSIYQHGLHIVANLEWNEHVRGNHYLADIVGLLFVASHVSANRETDAWLAFALQELLKETATQFHADGSNFEASTSYHRLSGEMLAYASAIIAGLPKHRLEGLRRVGPQDWPHRPALAPIGESSLTLPNWLIERLARAGEFAMAATHPDGTAMQIGDNDSGRFVKLLEEYPLDPRGLVAALNGLFHRPDFNNFSGEDRLETEIVAGLAKRTQLRSNPAPSTSYPDFGLFILRSGSLQAWVRCGTVGQNGNGGHAHDDQLSFELSIAGCRLIVDPGTYLYTPAPEQRNRFRSAAMHNTVTADEEAHHSFLPGIDSLFTMHDPEKPEAISWTEAEFVGRRPKLPHQRTLRAHDGRLHGIDECPLPGAKRIHFHLAPDIHAQLVDDGKRVQLTTPCGKTFQLSGGPGVWKINESRYSAGYGLVEPSEVVTLEFTDSRCEWSIGSL